MRQPRVKDEYVPKARVRGTDGVRTARHEHARGALLVGATPDPLAAEVVESDAWSTLILASRWHASYVSARSVVQRARVVRRGVVLQIYGDRHDAVRAAVGGNFPHDVFSWTHEGGELAVGLVDVPIRAAINQHLGAAERATVRPRAKDASQSAVQLRAAVQSLAQRRERWVVAPAGNVPPALRRAEETAARE